MGKRITIEKLGKKRKDGFVRVEEWSKCNNCSKDNFPKREKCWNCNKPLLEKTTGVLIYV